MDLTADLTLAARRAEAKQAIAIVLARFALPAHDRKAVLLDLAMDPAVVPHGTKLQSVPAAQSSMRGVAAGRRGRPRKRTNGAGGAPQGRTETLMATLGGEPGISIRALSTAVYGDDSQRNRNKTRSLLNALKKQKRVNNPQSGKWEVTE